MRPSRFRLQQRLRELIRVTAWAPDKQNRWLEANGLSGWHEASSDLIHERIECLERLAEKFSKNVLDSTPRRHNNRMDAKTRESLKVYFGEGSEEDKGSSN